MPGVFVRDHAVVIGQNGTRLRCFSFTIRLRSVYRLRAARRYLPPMDANTKAAAETLISYAEPHHNRDVFQNTDGTGNVIGFVRLMQGGHWQAYSYRRGCGISPVSSETAAVAWVREQYAKGPIAGYSR